jgi:hypothetical protein
MTKDAKKKTSVTFLVFEDPKTLSFLTAIHHKTNVIRSMKQTHTVAGVSILQA